MSKTSSKVKERWNRAHYDRLYIRVEKGQKAVLEAIAKSAGKSLNEWVNEAINEKRGVGSVK